MSIKKEWQLRVAKERIELGERLEKLRSFINSHRYLELEQEEQALLTEQQLHMFRYSDVLDSRIERWAD